MKLIIAGSREIKMYPISRAVDEFIKKFDLDEMSGVFETPRSDIIHEVVCGHAKGIDSLGAQWASIWSIPIADFKADWETYGRGAGMMRNEEMANCADGLLAIWDGKSRGTFDMITRALRKKLKTHVICIDQPQCCVRHKLVGWDYLPCAGVPIMQGNLFA